MNRLRATGSSTAHFWLWIVAAMMVCAGARGSAAPPATPWQAIVVGRQTEAERLATIDLQRYLGQVSGEVPVVLSPDEWRKHPRPAVAVGTADSNPLVRMTARTHAQMGGQGYRLEQRQIAGSAVVTAAGATAEGAVNAIYGLLHQLGYGFYLGSEALPQSLPDGLDGARTVPTPQLRVRGVLPWYNFFNSPTTWDPDRSPGVRGPAHPLGCQFRRVSHLRCRTLRRV